MKRLSNFTIRYEFGKILLLISLIVLAGCSNNTTEPNAKGSIEGTVNYLETGSPVKGAVIYTSPATITTSTDTSGTFLISNVPGGTYVVYAQKECCQKSSIQIKVKSDQTSTCNLQLTPAETEHTWDPGQEYSITSNPTGVWSYGRKWYPQDESFDLLTVRWGESGWYMGNAGHGAPSIQKGPILWAKNNTNGLPVVRWTNPENGYFSMDITFKGIDSRGVDVTVYITVNDSIIFSNVIEAYLATTRYSNNCLFLSKDDYIDFMIKWNGNIYYEYSWTSVNGTIKQYKENDK